MGLKINFSWMIISRLSMMFTAFISASLINRSLGPFDRGILAELQVLVAFLVVVFSFSLDSTIYHFSNREVYKISDNSKFVTIFLLNLLYSFLAVISFLVFVFLNPDMILANNHLVLLSIILLISTMLACNLIVFYQALNKFRVVAAIGLAQSVTNIVLVGVGFLFGILNIYIVVLVLSFVQIVAWATIIYLAVKEKLMRGSFSLNHAKAMILAGLKIHIATIITFVYAKFNQLLVVQISGYEEAGYFAVSVTLIWALVVIPGTFQTVLYPRVVHFTDDYEITIRSLRVVFYGWGLMILGLLIISKPIIFIYGGKDFILGSLDSFRILLLAAWFLPMASIVSPYLIKKGAFLLITKFSLLFGAVSLLMNFILIPKYGGIGAAWATSISCFLVFISSIIMLKIVSKKNPLEFLKNNGEIMNLYENMLNYWRSRIHR